MLTPGAHFGPYEIVSRLGAGGMGEVWRARDPRMKREVAIKVLPDDFQDAAAVERFAREARAAGALNHPGLVTILDVGTVGGQPYIVMEMLEGTTLRDVLGDAIPSRLPLRKTIDYAIQIACALAAAHEHAIVHRDLKPENLFITPDRRVKILDFGLAKLIADTKTVDPNRTTQRHLTGAGQTVGTPAYMSPEQVRAMPVDARTDIFSFGVVLYEMLAGRTPFEGPSAVESMHAILHAEPAPLQTLVPSLPPALCVIVHHCIEKDPQERFQSARDLAFQLETLAEMQNSAAAAPEKKRRFPRAAMLVLPLLLAAAAGGLALRGFRGGEVRPAARSYKQLTFNEGLEIFPALAPDGKSFAYVASLSGNRDIYVQRVDGRGAINVTNDSQDDDSEPAFSADGSQLAFRSERDGGGIFAMGVTGESVRRLTDIGHNPSWSPDGTHIVFSTVETELRPHMHPDKGSLWTAETHTAQKRLLLDARTPGVESDAMQPSWSPHGKRVAFWGVSNTSGERHVWTIDPHAPRPLETMVRVTSGRSVYWNPVWSPDGDALYFGSDDDGTLNLWRVAIDEETGKPSAPPEPLGLPATISGNFSVSRNNDVAFCAVTRWTRLVAYPLDLASGKAGSPRVVYGGSEDILSFEPSPDGKSIAYTTGGGAQEDVFIASLEGTRIRQLTNDASRDRGVTWSPLGKTLYFYSDRSGAYDIWSIDADGGDLTRITNEQDLKGIGAAIIYLPQASPDERTLVARAEKSNVFIHLDRPLGRRFETFGDRTIVAPKWSPDGTQLLGDAAVPSGRNIFVYSLKTHRLEPVLDHGTSPQWLPGGRKIAFFEEDRIGILDLDTHHVTMSAVALLPGAGLTSGLPPRVSRDGSTLFVRQTLEQGDIWMARLGGK